MAVTMARSTRKDTEVTSLWAMTTLPVTALVLPTMVLPGPEEVLPDAVTAQRPSPAIQVPLTWALPVPPAAAFSLGRAKGARTGPERKWMKTNSPAKASTTTVARPAAAHRSQ